MRKSIFTLTVLTGVTAVFNSSYPTEFSKEDVACMAEAIYHEARGQRTIGQLAVGLVIKNRMRDSRWPNTICEVVKQGDYLGTKPIKHRCQFTFWCDGKPEVITDMKALDFAIDLSEFILSGDIEIAGFEGITHYHTHQVHPSWAKRFKTKGFIDDHIFYKGQP